MAELAPIKFEIPGEVERPRSRGRSAANTVVPIDRARPEWLKVRLPMGPEYENLRRLMRSKSLHTVCEEAHCPNMAECWGAGTATFMILGDTCTRSCGFCAVKTGRPGIVDLDEPARVGAAVAQMALGHAVVTSVNRDELPGGGRRGPRRAARDPEPQRRDGRAPLPTRPATGAVPALARGASSDEGARARPRLQERDQDRKSV